MSDKKMYDILGVFNNLDPKLTPVKETEVKDPVYEEVEARGAIMEAVRSLEEKYQGWKKTVAAIAKGGSADDPEAVAASIGRKKYGKEKFQKAAAAGKKLGEDAKPDYIDLDKDGDKKEPMKQAAKDAKKKAVKEGEYDPAPIDPDAVAKRKRLQAIKDRQEAERAEKGGDHKSHVRTVKGKAYGGAAQKDAPETDDLDEAMSDEAKLERYHELIKQGMDPDDAEVEVFNDEGDEDLDEVAPPGAKAERMVKHIKKGYAKDGKLSKKEKGIAYATAWKAHNKGQLQESRMIQEGDYFYEKLGKALAEKNPTLNTADPSFVTAVRQEMVAQGIEPNRARNIIMMDDDFISDVATSYGHYCKEIAECGGPINSFVEEAPMLDAQQELDEIARLAGLSDRLPNPGEPGGPPGEIDLDVKNLKTSNDDKEEMDEGNEFTKARLDAIKAGKDTFTVGGKVHSVTGDTSQEKTQVEEGEQVNEDVNINITASGDEDVLALVKKLAGVQGELVPSNVAVPVAAEVAVEEDRDIEYANTPEEQVAPLSAAIPSGTDLNRAKVQDPRTANRAANPLAEKELEESLWKKYEDMIGDVKA